MESDIRHINGHTVHDEPQMPFDGAKSIWFWAFRRQSRHSCVYGVALDRPAKEATDYRF